MQYPNGDISHDLDYYNFVQYLQNNLKHIFSNQYPYMGDDIF